MKFSILRASILIFAPAAVLAGAIPELSVFALLTAGAAIATLVVWKRKVKQP